MSEKDIERAKERATSVVEGWILQQFPQGYVTNAPAILNIKARIAGVILEERTAATLHQEARVKVLIESIDKLLQLKPRWDHQGSFYKVDDVDLLMKEIEEALKKYRGEK